MSSECECVCVCVLDTYKCVLWVWVCVCVCVRYIQMCPLSPPPMVMIIYFATSIDDFHFDKQNVMLFYTFLFTCFWKKKKICKIVPTAITCMWRGFKFNQKKIFLWYFFLVFRSYCGWFFLRSVSGPSLTHAPLASQISVSMGGTCLCHAYYTFVLFITLKSDSVCLAHTATFLFVNEWYCFA